jgi:hypothetical protein
MIYLQVARGVSATNAGGYLAFMAADLILSGVAGGRLRWWAKTSGLTVAGLSSLTSGAARHRAVASFVDSVDMVFAVAAAVMAVAVVFAARLREPEQPSALDVTDPAKLGVAA